ncbi:Phage-related protein [uncultured Eubacterium sp.]|nr:Phage-related protein [uncultured Eubacterium sp.]
MGKERVEFYEEGGGKVPVIEFLNILNVKQRAKALKSIELLDEYGNQLREPHAKHIKDGIFELRIRFSNDVCRIFFFFFYNNKIIMTNGFIKKENKTPGRELQLALKYKADYERRHHDE